MIGGGTGFLPRGGGAGELQGDHSRATPQDLDQSSKKQIEPTIARLRAIKKELRKICNCLRCAPKMLDD